MKQEIWYQNLASFFSYENLSKFFPHKKFSSTEELNALFRFSLYLSILLYLYNGNIQVFMIPIIVGLFTYYTFNKIKNNSELLNDSFYNYYINKKKEDVLDLAKVETRPPTKNNPFMNPNLITEKNPDAKNENVFSTDTKEKIEKFYDENAYYNVDDIYNKQNGNYSFYTIPSTTIPNKQQDFAYFLYGDMKSCKDEQLECY